MESVRNIFITGITGSVGSWIAHQALEDDVSLVALVREDGVNHVADRVHHALETAGYKGAVGQVHAVAGDVNDPSQKNVLHACRSVEAVIHCAASMNFADEYTRRNYQVNVEGTRRMLDLAESLRVPFVYISTAYIAGKDCGQIHEEPLLEPPAFNNSYEETKYQAEKAVLDWSHRTGLKSWIFRPSIILGDSRTGKIVNFDAMYQILRFLDMTSGRLDGQDLRVGADPNATKNCIPVNYLARAVWQIFRQADPGIYHITHPKPLFLSELETIFKKLFDIGGASFVAPVELEATRLSKPEILFRRAASVYFPYLQREPVFDRRKTDTALGETLACPTLDVDYFNRIIDYARQVKWGQNKTSVLREGNEPMIVQSYYDGFLTRKIGRQLLPDLKRLNAQFKIHVSDVKDSSRTLTIRHGVLEQMSLNGQDHECTFTVNLETFQKITAGKLAPQEAFFRKSVEIKGDIETGLKLATVLSAFFRKYPYKPETR